MSECIFCSIVAGAIPATKVYEDEISLAFLDIHPVHPGHVLIIPREHHEHMLQTPDELVGQLFIRAKKLMAAVKAGTQADFVVLDVVGVDVPHFHIHLIPRYHSDGLKGWPEGAYGAGEAEAVAASIRKALIN